VLLGDIPTLDQADGTTLGLGPRPVGRSQIDDFLHHSIVSIWEQVAAREGITNSSIDTWALEMFRGCVEECMMG
jgi:hypothetical protein